MKLSPLVLLAAFPTAIYAQNEIECATAAEDADCVTCLTEGCVLTVGQCISSCDFIADASCWDMQYHEGKTVEEVCNEKAVIEADEDTCAAEALQSDCGACTSTAKSNGDSCEWYAIPEGPGYCGAGGCGFAGICGSTTCEGDDTTTTTEGDDDHPCHGFDLCEPCLNSRIECAWVGGACEPSCDAAPEAVCYHPGQEAFAGMVGPDICAAAEEAGDAKPEDTTTTTTATEPAEDDHPCHGFDLCEPCLNSRIECAWVGGICEPSCDAAPEEVCYHPGQEAFAGMIGPDICAAAKEAGDAKPVADAGKREGTDVDVEPLEGTSGAVMRVGSVLSIGLAAIALL